MRRVAILRGCGKSLDDALPQTIAQRALALLLLRAFTQRPLRRRGHAHNRGHVFSSRPALVFVRSAKLHRFNRQTGTEIEQARAFRSVKFMRGKTRGGQAALRQIGLHFPEGLHHVAVQQERTLFAEPRQLFHRLEHAGFVVRAHDGNERGVSTDRALEFLRIDQASFIHRKNRDVETLAFSQMFERVQDRVMFSARANQMTTARRVRAGESEHGEIVRLRSAARENQLVRFRAEQVREPIARIIHAGARFASRRVNARGIAVMPLEKREHRFQRRGTERRGRIVIEIDHNLPAGTLSRDGMDH